ncbi:mechanosensitive ion channel protein MscS [Bacillus sp. FJAT-27264]|uniref:mechanosensitive ion channel family protein n=1 Tax=Paenibacillus sp. (strain DSM 101736 / FJAT-27264) TaxID=1850362 RepID=UPI000807A841|nr:mechanosensitive ion channel family protein [Bacillus sp. FJAT-27264]OBZ08294.1 mechanosensitive ion channel protein MscS [Bacillus sp. FJAT-27264]
MNKWVLEATAGDQVKAALRFKDKVWNLITDVDMWTNILFSGLRLLLIFILTRVIIRVVYKVIDRSLDRKTGGRLLANTRRFTTVGELLKNVVTVICNFVMILLLLSEFNFNLAPLLASAGVLGLAIGFGAQSLVKDVITGFFIILEDQFAVGDVIQTGTYKGTVELIGLRTTKLLSSTGEMHIIPNGSITNVTNYSLANALAVVDVPVKMERSLESTLGLIAEALKGIEERNVNVLAYPNVLGIQSMSTSEYVIRVAAHCLPNARDEAQRQIQSDIKHALEKQYALEAAEAEAEAREKAEAGECAEVDEAATGTVGEGQKPGGVQGRQQAAATLEKGEEGK